jgi:hypothetical protein
VDSSLHVSSHSYASRLRAMEQGRSKTQNAKFPFWLTVTGAGVRDRPSGDPGPARLRDAGGSAPGHRTASELECSRRDSDRVRTWSHQFCRLWALTLPKSAERARAGHSAQKYSVTVTMLSKCSPSQATSSQPEEVRYWHCSTDHGSDPTAGWAPDDARRPSHRD